NCVLSPISARATMPVETRKASIECGVGRGSCLVRPGRALCDDFAFQPSTMSIENQLAEHRTYLLRYARLQLRNDAWAEDAVSETLLAALTKPQSFGNRSQLKTWLVGILKHK